MNNYEFCAMWALNQKQQKNVRALDYGCGAGQIVKELRKLNVDAYGCDVFYEGGDYSQLIDGEFFTEGVVKKMDGNSIPFDDASFDFVINNTVMEHVEDLDFALAEIHRVLKPGGVVLGLFPDKGVWREGHSGIPFLHWFAKNSRIRVYYAAGLRALGLGYHKGTKSVMHWSQDFCEWIDNWTHYRGQTYVYSTYTKYFCDIKHIESYWLQERLGTRKYLVAWLPESIQILLVQKLASMVFSARKPDGPCAPRQLQGETSRMSP